VIGFKTEEKVPHSHHAGYWMDPRADLDAEDETTLLHLQRTKLIHAVV
jgi:hypothetical protein